MTEILANPRHEQFCQLVAAGRPASAAYLQAWGPSKGARQSASRLLSNADISTRIAALRGEIAANLLQGTIREKDFRLQEKQNRRNLLLQVVEARAAEYRGIEALAALVDPSTGELDEDGFATWAAENPRLASMLRQRDDVYRLIEHGTPAGVTGLMLRDFRGKSAEQVFFKLDTGLLGELRALEREAAEEMGELASPGLPGGISIQGQGHQINIAFVQPNSV